MPRLRNMKVIRYTIDRIHVTQCVSVMKGISNRCDRKKIHFIIFLIALIALLPLMLNGQSSQEKMKFDRINLNHGLSNSNVNSIYQDAKGFMWVATADGLNKYDGYQFKVYRNVQGDTTGLLNNSIKSVFEDRLGTLWISTSNGGFYHYDRLADRFIIVREFLGEGEVTLISEDADHTLWATGVLNHRGFLAHLNRSTQKWEFDFPQMFPPNAVVTGLIQESKEEYWVSLKQHGLFKWNRKKNSFNQIVEADLNPFLHKMVQDANGNLWFATRNGLSKLNPSTGAFKHFRAGKHLTENALPVGIILSLCADGHNLWIGTENGGLSRMDMEAETFKTFTSDKNDGQSISDNSIWSIYKDNQKRLWIGTFSNGLCVYDKMKSKFPELNVQLNDNFVNAICKDQKGRLWIGTEQGLTLHKENSTKHYFHEPGRKGTLPNNPVLSIFEDSKGRLWIGTWDGGASRYEEQNDRFINYLPDPENPNRLSNPSVFSIREQSATQRILVSTFNGLNILVDEKSGKFEKHLDEQVEANNYLRTLFEDSHGALWVGSIVCLNLYDPDSKKHERFLYDQKSGSGVFVNCITEDNKGNVWVGSSKGLHQIRNNSVVETYTSLQGLPSDIVNGILIDNHGFPWLGTTNGISRFNTETKTFTNYDVNDGLVSSEFKANACYKTEAGQFLFGGKGVNVFYPDSIKTNPHIPPVFFTGLKILNKEVVIGAADSVLKQHITETREITLTPELNSFAIEYVGINYTSTSENQFAYKLEGFGEDWIYVGGQRFATFTNLDPGTYVFKVKASNNDGLWNEQGAALTIHILPLWYESILFKVASFVITAFLIIGVFFYRMRAIAHRNSVLENVVTERTAKLALANENLQQMNIALSQTNRSLDLQRQIAYEAVWAKEQFFSIMSHEIRTPLNSVIGLTYVLSNREPRPDQQEIIKTLKNSGDHLMHLVNDVLDYNKIQANKLELEVSAFDLDELVQQVHAMFLPIAQEKGLNFTIQLSSVMPLKLKGDPTRLIQILSNLISNAIKFTATGEVNMNIQLLRMETTHVFTEFRIKDTGIGIHEDRIASVFLPFSQDREIHRKFGGTGLGLLIVKNLTELMSGKIEVVSKLGEGSLFILSIPFEIQHISDYKKDQDQNSSQPPSEIVVKGMRVLYIEDVESNRFLVNNLLIDYGVVCQNANDGNEAIIAMEKNSYDIILMDVQLPDMDGYHVTRLIRTASRSKNKKTPVILFSAHNDIGDEQIKACGANGFVGKPFHPEILLAKIQEQAVSLGR